MDIYKLQSKWNLKKYFIYTFGHGVNRYLAKQYLDEVIRREIATNPRVIAGVAAVLERVHMRWEVGWCHSSVMQALSKKSEVIEQESIDFVVEKLASKNRHNVYKKDVIESFEKYKTSSENT